jgi:hypothetical protein
MAGRSNYLVIEFSQSQSIASGCWMGLICKWSRGTNLPVDSSRTRILIAPLAVVCVLCNLLSNCLILDRVFKSVFCRKNLPQRQIILVCQKLEHLRWYKFWLAKFDAPTQLVD